MPGIVNSHNVSYAYPGEFEDVIRNATFSIPYGSRVVVLGENGAGKSTLLRLINGNHKSRTGSLTIDTHDAFEETQLRRRVKYLSSSLPGYLLHLKSQHTVGETLPGDDSLQDRVETFLRAFSLHRETSLDALSDGEMRKLQILMHIVQPFDVLLVDECTHDVDVVGRRAFLDALSRATSGLLFDSSTKSTVLYATHILDDMQQWATHVLHVDDGRVVLYEAQDIPCIYSFARQFSGLSYSGIQWIVGTFNIRAPLFPEPKPLSSLIVSIKDFDVKSLFLQNRQRPQLVTPELLDRCTVAIPAGSRVILCGPNGSGKSILLQLLAGERFYSKRNRSDMQLLIGQRECFHDTTLVADIAYGGHWWDEVEPEWNLCVEEMLTCRHADWATCAYALYLIDLLGIDIRWRVNEISSGERKRVQLLLRLVPLRSFIFLDEATADLDVALRQKFLIFLQHLSLNKGVTVIYCSHIYEDLMWWGNYALFLRSSQDFCDTITMKYGRFIDGPSLEAQGGSFLAPKTERVAGVEDTL